MTRSDVGEHDDSMSIDKLTLGHDPSAATHRWHRWSLVIVTVVSSLAVLAMIGVRDLREPGALGLVPTPLNVLVLGDTSAGREGCATCLNYLDQLAAAWSQGGRRRVVIDDKTMSADVAASSMPALVESLRSTPEVRDAVSVADIILIAVGSGDVARPAAQCRAMRRTLCPEVPVRQFRSSLTAWMAETDTIRRHGPVMLRVITPPPTSGSPRQNDVARSACQIAAARGAVCVSLYNMARTDEHVVTAGSDPRHPQLTQHGHDLVATKLIAIGVT